MNSNWSYRPETPNLPTRVTSKTASLIDNIFCNGDINNHGIFTEIYYTDISDHFLISYIDNNAKAKQKERFFTKRIYSQNNLERFKNAMDSNDWSNILSSEDPQMADPWSCQSILLIFLRTTDAYTKYFNL